MKKFLSILLALVMLLSLTACSKKADKITDEGDTPPVEELETTYDFSSPEVDPENAPTYYYYIQNVPTTETGLTSLLTQTPGDGYSDKIQDEIRKIPQFGRSDINMQYMNSDTDTENMTPPEDGNDYYIYAQNAEYDHEVDVSVYGSLGYNYLTYGTTQTITDISRFESQLDIDPIPELAKATTGIEISRNDIIKAMAILQEIKAQQPDETIYMVSVTDPTNYNSIQVAMLPYEENTMVAITTSRYIETPAMQTFISPDDFIMDDEAAPDTIETNNAALSEAE